MSAYTVWKGKMLTSTGAGGNLRVQDINTSNRTVSEGIGYGMLISLYMNDQTTFSGLWKYAQAHFDGNGLMNWWIDSSGNTNMAGSATDADGDMAWALINAEVEWPGNGYGAAGKTMASTILSKDIANNIIRYGDNPGSATVTYPDYFAPAYYRVFASANGGWNAVVTAEYNLLRQVRNASTGLVPDTCNNDGSNGSGTYGYDACRMPWRIGLDWCLNGSTDAQGLLTPIATWASGIGATAIKGPISVTGGLGANPGGEWAGPFGVAAMVSATFQSFLNDSWKQTYTQVSPGDSYFNDSVGLMSMLVMSGNFYDMTQ